MRIATWNINGILPRTDLLLAWLEKAQSDVLCLQELKCDAAAVPTMPLLAAGYEVAAHAEGRWNGVAVLSRVGLDDVRHGLDGQPAFDGTVEPRAIAATCGGVRVWSLYVPNGRDPGHEHYTYKLAWLDALRATATAELAAGGATSALAYLGDYNVAPTDADVYDITAFEGATHVTAPERDALAALRAAGLEEVVPRPLKYEVAFTFWDYRQLAFPKNNGMRIDLVYGSPAFTAAVTDAYVDREARKGKGTSDHAPIVVDLDLP